MEDVRSIGSRGGCWGVDIFGEENLEFFVIDFFV